MSLELMLVLRRYIARAPIAQLLLQAKLEGEVDASPDVWRETCLRLLDERNRLVMIMDQAIENNRSLVITETSNVSV